MSKPEYGTPMWFNDAVMLPAVDRLMNICKAIAPTYTKGRVAPGYVPLTLKELQTLTPPEVAQMLGRMMSYPESDADGAKLARQYLPWADQQGFGPEFQQALVQAMIAEQGLSNG